MAANRHARRSWLKHLFLTLPLLIGTCILCLRVLGVSLPENLVCGRVIETNAQATAIVMNNLRAHYLRNRDEYMPGSEPIGGSSPGESGHWEVEASAHKRDGCTEEYFAEVARCGGAIVSSYKTRTEYALGSYC
jgi:hypothetical protein